MVPMVSKKSASSRVNTSSSAASTPTRSKEPNSEKSPSSDRSGRSTTESGRVGVLSCQPLGLLSVGDTNEGPTSNTASMTTASRVVTTMPIRMAARVRRTTRMPVSSRPNTNTSVGQPDRAPAGPSCSGTVVPAASGMRRTNPASTSPMSAMNSPMPTLMAVLSCIGMALKTALRRPTSTSTAMTSPSRTTRPIASAQLICEAIENVTNTFRPRPVATANG